LYTIISINFQVTNIGATVEYDNDVNCEFVEVSNGGINKLEVISK